MDISKDNTELVYKTPPDPNIQFEQLDELVSSAKQLFEEGHSLQSLELYSKALERFPQDQKILEARVEVCIKLKLFRRCLKDIDALTVIKSDDPKVHCLSGFVFEQVGEYEKSLSAYLKVYLLDINKCRFETANKIKKLCLLTVEGGLEDHDDTKGECIDALEQFVLFSKKLIEKEKYQVCLDVLKTVLMVHCMDETTSNTFKEELRYYSTKDNAKAEGFSETADSVKSSECLRRESRSIKFLENVDSETVHDALLRASECCYRLGKVHNSIWYAEKCLENALVSENFMNELAAYSKLAFLHGESGQRDSSISHHFQVLAKCRSWLAPNVLDTDQPTQPLRFWVSSLEKETLLRLCALFKGLELYEDAEKFAQEYFLKADIVDHDSLVKAYGMLGELERLRGDYEKSAKSHRTESALCLTFNDRRGLALAYGNLGKVHQASGRFALARECHELHLKIATAFQDSHSEAIACANLGELVVSQNKPEQALPFFEKQLRLATDNNRPEARCRALVSLGTSYQVLRLYQHAESFLRRALVEAREMKMHEEHSVKKSLAEVLRTLGKTKEALSLLFEVLEFLEFKFNTIRGYKIVTRHPVLNELNRTVDDTLEFLVEAGRHDNSLELAERNCGIVFHQMIEYKAFVEGSEFDRHQVSLNLMELQKLAQDQKKTVLFYRVVNNGYMVWVLQPTSKGVARFHWHKAPPESSFQETIEELINGFLKSRNQVASYSCDHRKLQHVSHRVTSVEIDEPNVSSSDPTEFLKKLSKIFLFPIEDALSTGSDSLEIVVVKNAFLDLVPFADLIHTSSGSSLQDLAVSVQVLPCIAVLGILNSPDVNPCRQIRVLGNPEMQGISETSFVKPNRVQLDLLEEELSDVSILLGVNADVGKSATKENFLHTFSSTSLLHLSTFGSHDDGVIAFAPVPNINPSAVVDDAWAVTLEEIVELRQGPDVVVFNSCYGCHNRFRELQTFSLALPLAFMIAGVKAVVMPTWSIPRDVLSASLCEFYKNLSNGSSVAKSLLKTKNFLQDSEDFQEPFSWTSFNLYGCDTSIPVVEIRRHCAESSFQEAQKAVSERFACDSPCSEEKSRPLISEILVETVTQLLHRHHLYPTLLPTLLDVVKEAADMLQGTTENSDLLPYREITPPWLAQILTAKNFLTSIGFLIKSTSSQKTILIYPHWNENGCLVNVLSVLQSVLHILSHSPILADALRVFVSQERKDMFVKFQDVLKQTLTNPEKILVISSEPLLRMFWVKPTCRRVMLALGFLRVGPVLDFRNGKEDINAIKSCVEIFTALTEFEDASDFKPHPMLSKANLDTSWMSQRASDEQNKTKLLIAQRLDSIHSKYKQEIKQVRTWQHGVLATQAKLGEGKSANNLTSNPEQVQGDIPLQKQTTLPASILPRIKPTKKETLDLTKFGGRLTRIKVESGSSPSCVRVPVVKEKKMPLIDCVMKRHESYQALYQCINHMKAKKREEIKKLVTL